MKIIRRNVNRECDIPECNKTNVKEVELVLSNGRHHKFFCNKHVRVAKDVAMYDRILQMRRSELSPGLLKRLGVEDNTKTWAD